MEEGEDYEEEEEEQTTEPRIHQSNIVNSDHLDAYLKEKDLAGDMQNSEDSPEIIQSPEIELPNDSEDRVYEL